MKMSAWSDLDLVGRDVAELTPRAWDIAQSRALLWTARAIRDDEKAEMGRAFSAPTPWTLNAFRVKVSRGDGAPSISVEVKDGYWYRADDYLNTQIMGGKTRKSKAFENALRAVGVLPPGWFAVPGQRAKLDAYGNQSVGEIRQILSYFDAAERVAGSTQNMGAKGRARRLKGTKKRAGWEYFVVRPGDKRRFVRASGKVGHNAAQPGIYRRTYLAMGSRIEPVVIFVKSVSYRAIFDFYGIARRTIDRHALDRLDKELSHELDRARKLAANPK